MVTQVISFRLPEDVIIECTGKNSFELRLKVEEEIPISVIERLRLDFNLSDREVDEVLSKIQDIKIVNILRKSIE